MAGRSARRPGAGTDRVVPGRAVALCQPESGSLQPDVGSGCGDIIIEKASSEDRRGHSPQTPRGDTPQGGKQHTGEPHPPTETDKPPHSHTSSVSCEQVAPRLRGHVRLGAARGGVGRVAGKDEGVELG